MTMSERRIRVLRPAAGGSTRMGPVDRRILPHRGAILLANGVRRASILDPVPIVVLRPGDREDASFAQTFSVGAEAGSTWVVVGSALTLAFAKIYEHMLEGS